MEFYPSYPLGMVRLATGPLLPLLFHAMNSKRFWATIAAVFSLSGFVPRSSGVWAQSGQAVCPAGLEWVHFV